MEECKFPKKDKLFCIDCKKYTNQKFIKDMQDKKLLYVCEVCGCQNEVEED